MDINQIIEQFLDDKETSNKVSNSPVVINEVLSWTNGQPYLTQSLFQIILNSESYISEGEEKTKIGQLVQAHLIDNWEYQIAARHLKKIRDDILKSQQRTGILLKLYEISGSGEVLADESSEVKVLLSSGLVIVQEGNLKVANPIYEAVFNREWIKGELNKTNEPSAQVWSRRSFSSNPNLYLEKLTTALSSNLESLGRSTFVGFEGGLLAIALASFLGTTLISTGLWLLILACLIFAQLRRWIKLSILPIIAVITFCLILFIPVLRTVIYGNHITIVLLLASFTGLLTLTLVILSNLIYKFLSSMF